MASVREALKQRAKNLLEDTRLKNYVNIAGELVVMNDDQVIDGGLQIADSSDRVSFSSKYFPAEEDEILLENIEIFRRVFGGSDPMTIANPSPPCSASDMHIIVQGLENRFESLSKDIFHMQAQSHDIQGLRTKIDQLQTLRNFIYTIQQNSMNDACEIYNEDGTSGYSVVASPYDDDVKRFLRAFVVFCLHNKSKGLENYEEYNDEAEEFNGLFIDRSTAITQDEMITYVNAWKQVKENQLPFVISEILDITGDKSSIQIEKNKVQQDILKRMRGVIAKSLGQVG